MKICPKCITETVQMHTDGAYWWLRCKICGTISEKVFAQRDLGPTWEEDAHHPEVEKEVEKKPLDIDTVLPRKKRKA